MSVLTSARRDLGTTTVRILAHDSTSRRWEPTDETVEVASQDLGGTEVVALGLDLDTEIKRLYCNLGADGELPITKKDRVAYEGDPSEADGRGWAVISVKKIPKGRDRGAIIDIRKAS